jgi:hypothetical protein
MKSKTSRFASARVGKGTRSINSVSSVAEKLSAIALS